MALYDLELAVQWVLDHIEGFGGNSSDIVLMGSGSGAWFNGAMLLSSKPFWRKQFSRFILQSESPFRRFYTCKASSLGSYMGCPSSASSSLLLCLRSLPWRKIVEATRTLPFLFGPSFTSEHFPREPWNLAAASSIAEKGILLGTVSNEGSGLVRQLTVIAHNKTSSFLRSSIEVMLSALNVADRAQLMDAYSNGTDQSIIWAHQLFHDVLYTCPLLSFAEYLAWKSNRVHAYIFDQRTSEEVSGNVPGAARFSDLNFLFRAASGFSPEAARFGRTMIGMWAQFAKTGTLPQVDNKPWPGYTATEPRHVRITAASLDVVEAYNVKACVTVTNFLPELKAWKET